MRLLLATFGKPRIAVAARRPRYRHCHDQQTFAAACHSDQSRGRVSGSGSLVSARHQHAARRVSVSTCEHRAESRPASSLLPTDSALIENEAAFFS
jgi:hypothetical protein